MIADYASAAKTTGTRYLNAAKNTENTRFLRHTQCAAGAEAAYKQSASKQTKMVGFQKRNPTIYDQNEGVQSKASPR